MTVIADFITGSAGLSQGLTDLPAQIAHWASQIVTAWTNGYAQVAAGLSQAAAQATAPLTSPTLWEAVLYGLLILVMITGIVGAFVPALPGITLVLGAIVVWGLVNGFAGLSWALGVAIAAFLLSIAIDYLAGMLGAQRVGASNWGQIGAVVGMLLGLFGFLPALPLGGPIFGVLFGTVLGAFVGEFLHRRELQLLKRVQQSFKVGLAIVVGTLVGNLLQGLLAFITLVVFVVTTWPTVLGT